MKKLLFLALLIFSFTTFANPSPVVQVISYKEPLGMYFSLQWWGSGSIIDKAWHILTNNHVVDDGFGWLSDDFSICITEDTALPPQCHFTASVIARDPQKDVAILQIDATDIFGRPVNFSLFPTLPLDYSYNPQVGDLVVARGYPWVGANTITETQGIISGTYLYNDNTYIKTDTLIAGGNSGGPLIRDGKIIGVNTFLIGGTSDPALWYSLSVREVEHFVWSAISGSSYLQSNNSLFSSFLQSVTNFTQNKKITDTLITLNLPQKYNVTTYIPGSSIQGQIAEENTTAVYAFSFMHFNIPRLNTPEEIRYFLSSQSFFPWQDVKFKTITIGGQSFYEVDILGNTGGDKTKTQYVYFKIVDENHLLLLQLATPLSNETTYPTIQKNISTFLAGISFPSQFTFLPREPISISRAWVTVKPIVESLVDFQSYFFPYNGIISELMATYDDLFTMRTYLGNLWSYAQISIVPNSFYTAGTTAQELLTKFKEISYFSENTESTIVSYKWHDGFIVCDNSNWSAVTDEKNISHPTVLCEVILLVGNNDSHFLSLIFLTDKRKKSDIYNLIVKYLDEYVIVDNLGKTNFGPTSKQLTYTDVAHQSQEFRDALSELTKYGILTPRNVFDGEHPLTWNEYIRLYVWAIYHKRLSDHSIPDDTSSPTFNDVIRTLPVDMNAYVNSSQRDMFELMLRMRLAGVSLPVYSEATLDQFRLQKDSIYHAEWQKIDDFEYLYFRGMKMSPNWAGYYNSGYYTSESYITYNPVTGLSVEPLLNKESIRFDQYSPTEKSRKALETELACTRTSAQYFSQTCFRKRQEYIWSLLSYPVLTKWEAISDLLSSIDFALWDDDLAKKKIVQIEESN